MSWQEYVDNNLMCVVNSDGDTLKSAALIGLDGNSVWASSPEFPEVSSEEIATIKSYLADPSSNKGSFLIGGVKYMSLGSDDPETKIRGKCAGGGCAISLTGQTLVVGIWAVPVTPSACNKIVETLAEYLISVEY